MSYNKNTKIYEFLFRIFKLEITNVKWHNNISTVITRSLCING